ncbi:MAG: hypothetical protein HOP30_04565 [Cyclobacteriaceae bacterium]|nr:hypothetical protein [Cyclobacteriaceae bacterium]
MMDQTNHNKSRVLISALVISHIANVGLFFYGLVNKTAAKMEQGIALELKTEVEKCRLESALAKQELQNALVEARQAKDYAFAQAMAAKEASSNKK